MKTTIKWFAIFMGVILLLGIISLIFESDEDKAARESKLEQDKIAADQDKADKLQAKADKQAAKEKAEAGEKAKDLNDDKMSDTALYIKCQVKIQDGLKNPRSFDPEIRSLKYIIQDNGDPLIGFKFYAENSFGGEEIHQAVCGFDKDGEIVTAGYK